MGARFLLLYVLMKTFKDTTKFGEAQKFCRHCPRILPPWLRLCPAEALESSSPYLFEKQTVLEKNFHWSGNRSWETVSKTKYCCSLIVKSFAGSKFVSWLRLGTRRDKYPKKQGCQVVISKKCQINSWKSQIQDKYTTTPLKHQTRFQKAIYTYFIHKRNEAH